MSKHSFVWYRIRQFASAEKIDDVPSQDLLVLCGSISDIVIAIFRLDESGTSIYLRVPDFCASQVESIISFGKEKQEYPVCTKIQSLVELKLRKKSVYPLVSNPADMHHNVFSLFSSAPQGAIFLKLSHTDSKKTKRQYDSIKRRYEKQKDDAKNTNWHESACKAKADCRRFFHAQLFFGTLTPSDIDDFERILPCVGRDIEPNGLVRKKSILYNLKHPRRALDFLEKILLEKSKKSGMVLSENDIVPFVRFPENADRLQMEPASSETFSSGLAANVPDPQKEFEDGLS